MPLVSDADLQDLVSSANCYGWCLRHMKRAAEILSSAKTAAEAEALIHEEQQREAKEFGLP